jgi:hypothetical protein
VEMKREDMKICRLAISDEAIVELTRRVAKGGGAHNNVRNTWSEYVLILALATKLLRNAPQTSEDVEQMNVEERVAEAVCDLIEVLHVLFPGGVMEIISHLPQELRDFWHR